MANSIVLSAGDVTLLRAIYYGRIGVAIIMKQAPDVFLF